MRKTALLLLLISLAFSCKKDEVENEIKESAGVVSLSGGSMFCASQIRLDNGDTLIVDIETVYPLTKSGGRVAVKYRKTGVNKLCPPAIDCEVIEIKKIN